MLRQQSILEILRTISSNAIQSLFRRDGLWPNHASQVTMKGLQATAHAARIAEAAAAAAEPIAAAADPPPLADAAAAARPGTLVIALLTAAFSGPESVSLARQQAAPAAAPQAAAQGPKPQQIQPAMAAVQPTVQEAAHTGTGTFLAAAERISAIMTIKRACFETMAEIESTQDVGTSCTAKLDQNLSAQYHP